MQGYLLLFNCYYLGRAHFGEATYVSVSNLRHCDSLKQGKSRVNERELIREPSECLSFQVFLSVFFSHMVCFPPWMQVFSLLFSFSLSVQ